VARIAAPILRALAKANWRAQRTAGSVGGNNFLLVCLLLLQRSGVFLYVLIGLVLLLPLSADPLERIPRERLGLWPIEGRELRLLRLLAPWLAPGAWIVTALLIAALKHSLGFDLLAVLAALCGAGFALSFLPEATRGGALRLVPAPPGRWGQLVRKDLRQMLVTLDVYIAVILCAGGIAYRIADRNAPFDEAGEGIMLLVLVALSGCAQSLFGLDGAGGRVRYALLPLRGWEVLMAKDAAFLTMAVALTAPLNPVGGLAGALVALAFGHATSLNRPRAQVRWRFTSTVSIPSLLQTGLMVAAAVAASRHGAVRVLPLCGAAWAVSVWWYGRSLEN
jgi:hypothetical protein